MYRKLADLVAVLHILVILVLVFGPLLYIQNPAFKETILYKLHTVLVITTGITQALFLGCPLSLIEEALRRKDNPSNEFAGSFIAHYLNKYFGVKIETSALTAVFAIIVIFTIVTYIRV